MQVPSLALAAFVSAALLSTAHAQCEVQEIGPPPDGPLQTTSQFGRAVGVSGAFAVVGAKITLGGAGPSATTFPSISPLGSHPTPVVPTDPPLAGTFGIAFLFQKLSSGAGWALQASLHPTDADAVDDFGAAVAIDAGVMAVANPRDDDFGPDSGSVYVYRDQGAGFVLVAKLHASDAGPGARFGAAVSVSGGRILVGAPGAPGGPSLLPGVGAAYVFEPLGLGAWIEVERLSDPFGQPGDAAGSAVALSGAQGLVGAPGQTFPFTQAGAVYAVQQFSPGTWLATAKLGASDAAPFAAFGSAVALEGGKAVVGAPGKSGVCAGCGGAYLFSDAGFGAWVESAKLFQGIAPGELAPGDDFGAAVAIAQGVAAVSAPEADAVGFDSGAAYAFQSSLSGYVLTNRIDACTPEAARLFGRALDAEQGTLIAGAPGLGAATGGRGAAFFATLEVIEVSNESIAIFFSEPDAGPAAAFAPGPPSVDPQCFGDPLFPQIEIEDLIDDNPLFEGHRFVLKGRIWELCLVEHPIAPTFTYDGYDPSTANEVFKATPADCGGPVVFDLEHDVIDEETGDTGTLATFSWTDCQAKDASFAELGPFEVKLSVFMPNGQGQARFDLSADPIGPAIGWAFWCGKLNLSVVEDHLGSEPGATFHLLTPFGHLVTNPGQNLIATPGGIPPRADALGRPSNQALGFYDDQGRGFYAALADPTGNRAKNFQFFGCPGDGSVNPTVNIVSLSFQDDVSPDAPFKAVRSFIGRFRGDWYDLADHYRDWLVVDASITNGLVKDRTDVPAFAKRMQMATVLDAGITSYTGPSLDGPETTPPNRVSGIDPTTELIALDKKPLDTVPERLAEYMDHYDLDRMITLQFGTDWAEDGCAGIGEYVPNAQFAENAELMQAKEDELAAQGKELKYMLYFLDTAFPASGTGSVDWMDLVLRNPALNPIYLSWCGPDSHGLMDPATDEWQDHMFNVSQTIGMLGVDGIYCDNAFPELRQYDFSEDHGHAPGFGPYLTQGFADMFDAIQAGGACGNPSVDPDFITYTEFFFEGYIARSDTYGPEQLWTDWMTADENTVNVPLISTLYHHYTILGPPFVGTFTHDAFGAYTSQNHVLNLGSADEREDGRRSANITMANGWVNGCPIWCPDPAIADPVKKRFSFELLALEQTGQIGLPETFTFGQLAAVCDFGAQLARVRGFPFVEPFLMVGRRLRDFDDFAVTPASVSVELAEIFNPYNPSAPQLGPETQSFPPILHGVWEDLTTSYVGVALANYTDAPATATFTFDPEKHGFEGAVGVYVVSATGETLHTGPFVTPTVITVELDEEEALFLRVRP